jgi:hypothetical protein
MKKLCVIASALAILLAATNASAQSGGPHGDPEVGKKLWSFKVLVRPNGWVDTGNACNGARIFFTEGGDGGGEMGVLTWLLGPYAQQNFQIVDCNGTDGAASVLVPDNQGNVVVAIRVVGPKTSNLRFACLALYDDVVGGGEDLCVIDNVNLNKSKNFTKVLKNIADNDFENVLWTFDSSGTWKIFQVRVHRYVLRTPPVLVHSASAPRRRSPRSSQPPTDRRRPDAARPPGGPAPSP